MTSVRDVVLALDEPTPVWSLRESLQSGMWPPPPSPRGTVSLRALMDRLSEAGQSLRKLASGTTSVWPHIDRATLVAQLRDRLRDPGVIVQNPTGLCGPIAILFELARRRPAEYVRAATELFETGQLTVGDVIIRAEEELRNEPMPAAPIVEADWLFAATMRDDANLVDDVDGTANGFETITLWIAMARWTRSLLGLRSHWEKCFEGGELDAIRKAQEAVDAGGVAFLLIHKHLIDDAASEEQVPLGWRRARHQRRTPVGTPSERRHCRKSSAPPDHWVALLGDLQLSSDDGPIALHLWSWGKEYWVDGSARWFTEYLYAIVTGT
ncbi:MAG: hypothetical protein U0441_35410 [Polyangiaceae bacterium]